MTEATNDQHQHYAVRLYPRAARNRSAPSSNKSQSSYSPAVYNAVAISAAGEMARAWGLPTGGAQPHLCELGHIAPDVRYWTRQKTILIETMFRSYNRPGFVRRPQT